MREINGDFPLTKKQKIQYLFFNFFRGIWGFRVPLKTKYWYGKLEKIINHSPGRHNLDNFLYKEIPNLVTKKEIDVLDIGCGTGYIRKVLADLGYSGNYVGVDVVKEKKYEENENSNFKSEFIKSTIEEFKSDKKFDLVVSMTSFEHIEDDKKAAEQSEFFVKEDGLQMHFMPSFWSLPIYFFHGYRQYYPARVKEVFSDRAIIYRIGGFASCMTALFFMTIPERLTRSRRLRDTKLYRIKLRFSNNLDKYLRFCSQTYGIIIPSKNEK